MSTNFASLYPVAYNLGLGSGADGFCHLMQVRLSDLLPIDVESGRIDGDDELNMYVYGTHVGFSVSTPEGKALANERTLHTIPELVSFLHSVYTTKDSVVVEEDEELDERLEAIREAALKADLVESDDEDDEFFEDEDGDDDIEMDDEDVESSTDDDVESQDGEDSEEDDDEPVYITIAKPSAKANTKKFNKDLADTAAVLQEYFDEELAANGIDTDGLIEVLGAVFDEVAELEIDTGVSFFEQVSDYVELE